MKCILNLMIPIISKTKPFPRGGESPPRGITAVKLDIVHKWQTNNH
jgi:hypothetical protein